MNTPDDLLRLNRVNEMLALLWERNRFYAEKWRSAAVRPGPLRDLSEIAKYPFTQRTELVKDQESHPPLGLNLTFGFEEYKRFHSSSGTTRVPLFWADTAESWSWLLNLSQRLYSLAEVTSEDRIFLAIPPGRSLGPTVLLEGAVQLGAAVGRTTTADLEEMVTWMGVLRPTVIAGRPRLLHSLADLRPRQSPRILILTGAATVEERSSLENKWGARAFDRYGLTEAGSVAGECPAHSGGMHLLDEEFLVESIHPGTGREVADGEPGELVLTGLGRTARPVVRYRTGDQVRLIRNFECRCGRTGTFLAGGVQRMIAPHAGAAAALPNKYRSTSAAV